MNSQDEKTQQIEFFTGKGGVGKSTLAAARALALSKMGQRVLLVELGEHSFYELAFGWRELKFKPQEIRENLWAARWSGPEALRDYLLHFLKSETVLNWFLENKVMRTFVRAAPGIKELALVGKITSGVRKVGPELPFDTVVVDCFATGHALALFRVASGMSEVFRLGPMGEQSRHIDQILKDPEICRYWIVSLPTEMAVTEAIEMGHSLTEMQMAHRFVLNRLFRNPISESSLKSIAEDATNSFHDFAGFLEHRLERQKQARHTLAAASEESIEMLPLRMEADNWQLVEKLSEGLREK